MNNLTHSAIFKDKIQNVATKLVNKADKALAKILDEQNPSLENPVQYKVVHRGGALVREGIDTTTAQVYQLSYGETVAVVELQGRRARMITPVYGWVSVRTKDGMKILEQKHIQTRVSVRHSKGFEKAFEERFNKVKDKSAADAYDRRKRLEEQEFEATAAKKENGNNGFASFDNFNAGFANDLLDDGPTTETGPSTKSTSTSTNSKGLTMLAAPRDVGNTPIPKLGAPSNAPVMAPAKKQTPDIFGGFSDVGTANGNSGGGVDLFDFGDSARVVQPTNSGSGDLLDDFGDEDFYSSPVPPKQEQPLGFDNPSGGGGFDNFADFGNFGSAGGATSSFDTGFGNGFGAPATGNGTAAPAAANTGPDLLDLLGDNSGTTAPANTNTSNTSTSTGGFGAPATTTPAAWDFGAFGNSNHNFFDFAANTNNNNKDAGHVQKPLRDNDDLLGMMDFSPAVPASAKQPSPQTQPVIQLTDNKKNEKNNTFDIDGDFFS